MPGQGLTNAAWLYANAKGSSDAKTGIAKGMAYGQAAEQLAQGFASYYQMRSQAYQYQAQASIAENNAALAQMNVDQAFKAGEAQVAAITAKAGEVKARQRVAFAANGIALGTGSTAEVMASTDIQKEVDKHQAEINALYQAWGFRRQKMMLYAQAKGARVMAKAAKSIGNVQLANGIFQAAASMYAGYKMG